jgi:beta-glucanase (GH16 family)
MSTRHASKSVEKQVEEEERSQALSISQRIVHVLESVALVAVLPSVAVPSAVIAVQRVACRYTAKAAKAQGRRSIVETISKRNVHMIVSGKGRIAKSIASNTTSTKEIGSEAILSTTQSIARPITKQTVIGM